MRRAFSPTISHGLRRRRIGKEFSELDLQLVMNDLNDTDEERSGNVIAGVAISAEDVEGFAADVERIVVECTAR